MKTKDNDTKTPIIITTTTTIEEILKPLVGLLNQKYAIPGDKAYEINRLGQFGALEQNSDEIAISLPNTVLSNTNAVRAIANLLWRSSSTSLRIQSRFRETDPCRGPLRFALLKSSFWLEHHFRWDRYLIVDYVDERLDEKAARRQIDLLVKFLRNPSSLSTLGHGDLAMF